MGGIGAWMDKVGTRQPAGRCVCTRLPRKESRIQTQMLIRMMLGICNGESGQEMQLWRVRPGGRQVERTEHDKDGRGRSYGDEGIWVMGRAIAQTRHYGISGGGDPADMLELVEKQRPPAGSTPPGSVLVRITMRAINPTDLMTVRYSRFQHLVDADPATQVIVGSDGCGVVDEIGDGVTQFRVGQRVTPIIFPRYLKDAQGSWQEYLVVDAAHVFAIPESVSDEAAAQFVVNSCTAAGLLKEVGVPAGDFVLQTAASSVIGRQVIQLARHWGIKTINIVRRDSVKAELEALGADVVINSSSEDVLEKVKEVTGGKLVYAAFDAVVGGVTPTVASCVRGSGRLLLWGALASLDVKLRLQDLMRKVKVEWWILPDFAPTEAELKKLGDEVMVLLEKKVIQPLAGEKFDLADYRKALHHTEKPARGGKVYLVG